MTLLSHLGLTADRVRELCGPQTPPPPEPRVLRTRAIIRSEEDISHAKGMFEGGATFRQVRAATGMSMAKLKKIKEGITR